MNDAAPVFAAASPLAGIGWALCGYLVLQLILNLVNVAYVRRAQPARRPLALVVCAFWSGVANALYFIACAVVLRVFGLVDNSAPAPGLGYRALLGIAVGPLLWYWLALARKAGRSLFGVGELISADEAILRAPPGLNYVSWGISNLGLLQPLGRELFVRGVFLATVQRVLAAQISAAEAAAASTAAGSFPPEVSPLVAAGGGWPLAIGLMLVVDILLRINIVWLPSTLAYGLSMAALFYFTGDATAGLSAACIAGLIQSVVLLRLTLEKYKQREAEKEKGMLG